MTDLKTGKLPKREDERTLLFERYVDQAKLPPVPGSIGHADRMPQPRLMLGNGPDNTVAPGFQGAGDCMFAAITNAQRLALAISGPSWIASQAFTGHEAISAYSEVTGYRIGDDSTDNGTVMLDALNWWRTTGILDSAGRRHKIAAFAEIKSLAAAHRALWHLDVGVLVGIKFPSTAMDQFQAGKPWSVVHGATDEGGHAILYDARKSTNGDLYVETWGRDQPMSRAFARAQIDEMYAVFTPEALVRGVSLEGFDAAQLVADLQSIAAS